MSRYIVAIFHSSAGLFAIARGRVTRFFLKEIRKIIFVREAELQGDLLHRKIGVDEKLLREIQLFFQNVGVGSLAEFLFEETDGLGLRFGNVLTKMGDPEFLGDLRAEKILHLRAKG